MVDQNGSNVNPERSLPKMGAGGNREKDWRETRDRLALAEWKIEFLSGYLHGLEGAFGRRGY